MDTREYIRLQRETEAADRAAHIAEGQYRAALTELREKYACDSLTTARKKLAALDRQCNVNAEKLNRAHRNFTRKWKRQLDR